MFCAKTWDLLMVVRATAPSAASAESRGSPSRLSPLTLYEANEKGAALHSVGAEEEEAHGRAQLKE